MKQISANITYAEATKSQNAERLGIKNEPNESQLAAMQLLAVKVFEPTRKWFYETFGKGLYISCFFRSPELNNATPGASQFSQHPKGEAMDIDADILGGGTNADVFHFIKENLTFDQLIWEFGDEKNPAWVHVSYKETGNRRMLLRAIKENGQTKYIPY